MGSGIDEPEHRRVTVGFVHVGGVDTLVDAEGAEATQVALDAVVSATEASVARAGATLLASDISGRGAKLILTCGAPDALEDSEGRMLTAARELLDSDLPLPLRIGIHSGPVFAGSVGAPWRRTYTVMGDVVNLAARLMGKAEPGQAVVSKLAFERSATPFHGEPLAPFFVKGKARAQEAYVLGGRLEGRERRAVTTAPFTGRERELAVLRRAAQDMLASRGTVVEVVGDAGVGKTRIIDECLSELTHVPHIRVTCEPFLADRAYFVARLVFRRVLGIPIDASDEDAGPLLVTSVEQAAPHLTPLVPLLALMVGAEVASTPEADEIGESYRSGALREVAAQLLTAVATAPTVFRFEDSNWMDEASARLFERVVQGIDRRPWLVCLTRRPVGGGLLADRSRGDVSLHLEPLEGESVLALAMAASEDRPIGDHELGVLVERAAGNPLFLLELLSARDEVGSLDELPSTLEDLIGARIDALPPGERRLLRYASVLGDRFKPALAAKVLGDSVPEATSAASWNRLGSFIVRDGADLRFSHMMVRTVAYEGLPFRRRQELHERVAETIASSAEEPSDSDVGMLALHFHAARRYDEAWRWSREAGDRARATYANTEAAAYLSRAVDSGRRCGAAAAEVGEVAESLGDVCERAARFAEAKDGYSLARDLLDDRESQARLCRKEGVLRERAGKYPAALRWFSRGMRVAEELPEDVAAHEQARIALEYAGVRMRQGRLQECVAWCRDHALPAALKAGDRAAEARAYYLMEAALTDLGRPEAEQYRAMALPIFEELGDLVGQANVLNNLAVNAVMDGDWQTAIDRWEFCRSARRRVGDVLGIAFISHNLGELRSLQGRLDEADELLREARRIWRSSSYPWGVAIASSGLGRVRVRQGRFDEGEELLRTALELQMDMNSTSFLEDTLSRMAEAHVYAGRWDEGIEAVDHELEKNPTDARAVFLRTKALALLGVGRDAAETFRDALEASKDDLPGERAVTLAAASRCRQLGEEACSAAAAEAVRLAEDLGIVLEAVLPAWLVSSVEAS